MPDRDFKHEKQSSRAYLIPMANKHARENANRDVGEALADFLATCPEQPKDEREWLEDHYRRVHDIHNTETKELPPI